MFVQTNTVKSIRNYFKEKLSPILSDNEIKLIGNEVVCSRLNLSKAELIGANDFLLSESDLLYFRSIVKRLLNNEPFQYIVGNAYFYGLELKCDKRALIPRPETEELVDWIKNTLSNNREYLIADICSGSGCIALALKSIFSNSRILATDISNDALNLASENANVTSLEIEFHKLDATNKSEYFSNESFEPNSFDCWVSNPPYIPINEKKEMHQNILNFEPHVALFVSEDNPLLFYQAISELASIYLKPKGFLFFEIHENFGNEMIQLLQKNGFGNVELKKDLQGKNRMSKAQKL